jgi:hypothetical protein
VATEIWLWEGILRLAISLQSLEVRFEISVTAEGARVSRWRPFDIEVAAYSFRTILKIDLGRAIKRRWKESN